MLWPFRKIESSSLSTVLRDQWFYRNSVPEVVISDNASCFLSKEFRDLLARFDVRHWLNAKYHSQANPVERVNRTVNAAIRTYVREDQRMWDTRLSEIETVLNSSLHSATSMTPYFTTHGYEMLSRGSDHNKLTIDKQEPTDEGRTAQQNDLHGKIRELVQTKLKQAHQESQKRYDLRHRAFGKTFKEGQLVYRRNMRPSCALENYNAKLGSQFIPARIKKKKGSSSYELEDLDGKSLGIWPATHIKPG